MKSIAIITARGGSKRIPRKNIKPFCGRPIISYSINAALSSGLFDEVMVSTDSEEIAQISRQYGAAIPFMRSEQTSNDFAATPDVLLEVLSRYRDSGREFDIGCCIYPTAPFITACRLTEAFSAFMAGDADSLIPVCAFSFPPQRGVFIRDNRLVMSQPEYLNTRSQDIETMYHDCGQFYIFSVKAFMKAGSLVTDNTMPFVIDELEVQDIDNVTDWELAELKYKLLHKIEE